MAQHQSNQPPPQQLRAKAAVFGYNKKGELQAVILWLLRLALGGWQNSFTLGWAVRGHQKLWGLFCTYCLRR